MQQPQNSGFKVRRTSRGMTPNRTTSPLRHPSAEGSQPRPVPHGPGLDQTSATEPDIDERSWMDHDIPLASSSHTSTTTITTTTHSHSHLQEATVSSPRPHHSTHHGMPHGQTSNPSSSGTEMDGQTSHASQRPGTSAGQSGGVNSTMTWLHAPVRNRQGKRYGASAWQKLNPPIPRFVLITGEDAATVIARDLPPLQSVLRPYVSSLLPTPAPDPNLKDLLDELWHGIDDLIPTRTLSPTVETSNRDFISGDSLGPEGTSVRQHCSKKGMNREERNIQQSSLVPASAGINKTLVEPYLSPLESSEGSKARDLPPPLDAQRPNIVLDVIEPCMAKIRYRLHLCGEQAPRSLCLYCQGHREGGPTKGAIMGQQMIDAYLTEMGIELAAVYRCSFDDDLRTSTSSKILSLVDAHSERSKALNDAYFLSPTVRRR